MRRTHVVLLMAMAGVGLLLMAISAMAGRGFSHAAPLAQTTNESEPNNSCSEANEIALAAPVLGAIDPITDTDWFYVATQSGLPYYASAAMTAPEFKVRLCVYDENCHLMSPCSSASASNVDLSWTAAGSRHYLEIEKYDAITDTTKTTSYLLEVVQEYVSPPTSTPTPSATPSPWEDDYEQNDSFAQAYSLPVETSVTLVGLEGLANFYPLGDEDWFKFWAKDGKWYQATTGSLSGVDTYMEVRDQNNSIVKNDDDGGGGYASQAKWEAEYDGYYYIRLTNKVQTTGSYDLSIEESAPSSGPSPTPAPGADTQADSCEDNLDFAHACVIPANQPQTFNLVPPYGGVDNDFFKIWVKPGFIFECATSNLSPGVDTNMIVFNGPSWDNAVGGNDDVEPGNYDSYFAYYSTYEGWLYLLVGTGDRTPSNIYDSNYTLRCDMRMPGQTSTPESTGAPTPAPTSDSQAATPTLSSSPVATPVPSEDLTVRTLTTPTPVPATTPAPRFIPISLLVYYDANDDHQAGAGEGIAGVSAQAYEAATNQLLAQGFTDEQGGLEFTVAAQGPVRVSVPFLGFSQLMAGEGASIYVRVPPKSFP
ncbi:MAG: PPC domain-containing protein [Chloroflexota bacterium]|nr:PPC domain-containing protein [Chloroflexota bacterium]